MMHFNNHNRLTIATLCCFLLCVTGCNDDENSQLTIPTVLAINQPAPNFKFQLIEDTETQIEALSDYKGKVIYLDFWASWCKPCLKSMPFLDQLRTELKPQGFEVIAVNLDSRAVKGVEFIKNNPVTYAVVRALDQRISSWYQVNALPTSFIIDRQGVLRFSDEGFKDQDMIKIRQHILSLLNTSKPQ